MLQAAIDLQRRAVGQLVHLTDALEEITFRAPTGSGKTYMMADMMNRILARDRDVVFLVSTLSKGDLATQNYDKFAEYNDKGLFSRLRPYLISSDIAGEERLFVPTDFNVYLLPRDLYKKRGRLMQGAMEGFLSNLTSHATFNGLGKRVYLIKDECHIATNNLDNLSTKYFSKVYNFSATPNLKRGQHTDVEITNADAVAAKLIKDIELEEGADATVNHAINKFQEVKTQYRNMLHINPCLIIQISNKDKADAELHEIFASLNKAEHADLKWMLIVNNDKECDTNDNVKTKKLAVRKWKDYAKDNTSTVDVIIFKMVITEGWDIPRACMLYQMRDSKSKQLDEQVMGRVRRNPRLLDFATLSDEAQQLAMTAWIWGIVPDRVKKSICVKARQDNRTFAGEIKIKGTRLKPLERKPSFNIADFLEQQPEASTSPGIFKLFADYNKATPDIRQMCDAYATDYARWYQFVVNIRAIEKAQA
ncbi:MAG: DEAD/DEAH box helicase family protein [Defluviitaleaceae bacterium]|nr:DEAD/DEAH box helicase family protein [Defluviitaleaceae bacterium]